MSNFLKFVATCSLLALVACGSSGGSGDASFSSNGLVDFLTAQSLRTETQPFAADATCSSLLSTAPRGLTCLHCTQPEAQSQAFVIAQTMLRSCLENLATNYLVDGTFSFDLNFLIEHTSRLSSNGRRLFATFFLGNGPSQRRFSITQSTGFGTQISPASFRAGIQSDPALQAEYQALVARLIPVISQITARGGSVSIVPMLEDNLDDAAFNSMVALTLEALPDSVLVSIGRNSCVGDCPAGLETSVPEGIFLEVHTGEADEIFIQRGIISNDGWEYHSPVTGYFDGAVYTLRHITLSRDAAGAAGNAYVLWSSRRQGLPPAIQPDSFPTPSGRDYVVPSEAEIVELITFLRGGEIADSPRT